MKTKLRDEDRRAVDLILDRSQSATGKAGAVYGAANSTARERIVRVQEMLQLLDAMPAAEPPKDLVARTMEFIESAAHNGRTARASRAILPTLASQPPVA